jgi:hypothetical protein
VKVERTGTAGGYLRSWRQRPGGHIYAGGQGGLRGRGDGGEELLVTGVDQPVAGWVDEEPEMAKEVHSYDGEADGGEQEIPLEMAAVQ